MTVQSLMQVLEARKQELFDLLSSLIRIDSQNFGSTGQSGDGVTQIGYYGGIRQDTDPPRNEHINLRKYEQQSFRPTGLRHSVLIGRLR